MTNKSSRNQNTVLYITDILVLGIASLLGLLIRYKSLRVIPAWQGQLYMFLITFFILAYTLIFLLYRKNRIRLTKMDPFENLVLVGHNTFFLAVMTVFALFAAEINSLSKTAVFVILVLFFCLDTAARIGYRRYLFKIQPSDPVARALLITTADNAAVALRHFRNNSMEGRKTLFTGVVLLDADKKRETIEGIPVLGNAADLETLSRSSGFDMALFHMPGSGSTAFSDYAGMFLDAGKDVDISINYAEHLVTADMLQSIGSYETVHLSALGDRCRVLGVDFRVSNVDEAVLYVCSHLEALKGHYICFSNSHTTVMSRENDEYRTVQNSAALVFADGAPIVRVQRKKGFAYAERVAGPDFMDAMFRASMDGSVSHYFYGSTPENIALLEKNLPERYPGIVIKGLYSPPFGQVTEEEDRADIERINSNEADIVWVGLGAPKQEKWMAAHDGKIDSVMIGVGAGFDFYAGTVQRAPKWVQKIGLEWLYRLCQDPKRLIKRYLVTNFKFILYSLLGKHD